ncbi:glycoside hydrolase family 36 protein [Stenotrophomonas sp. 24(2023)]|uniref:glycoside hydrolase family 36 protein n=1 Tax=Stenotrophomonas sp. 24(2023) TaxID=3068324 RepID=UPI0027DF3765|nr:glycoside hydrolase family 36 protein [Stenotrophomonas sp. 24(2023)]WMJ70828.1 alpha-galactosidase [Stenotrophomonas sp. 24(2023)]
MPPIGRRTALKFIVGGVAGTLAWSAAPWARATPVRSDSRTAGDSLLGITFDSRMHTRLARNGKPVTAWRASEVLQLASGDITDFALLDQQHHVLDDPRHGPGRQAVFTGRNAAAQVEKQVAVSSFERLPGLALVQVRYRNLGTAPLAVTGWRNSDHEMRGPAGSFWSFSGTTHTDRRDWAQPVTPGFEQRNSLGMDSSDYGGGTPVANIWRRDLGLAVGHVEPVPRPLCMPVRQTAAGASLAIASTQATTLAPGATLTGERTFIALHTGDFYAPLQQYQAFMKAEGIQGPVPPASAFAPVWCAWGYERDFTLEQIYGTLPKARELGFEWAVLDDGWQTNEGDWDIDLRKFPRGDQDMRAFTARVREQGMRPRLWLAPLAADPGSNVLHKHVDMLLLDKEGAFQTVTWWNALTQCPAYPPTIDFYVALVKKAIGDWGFEGIKLDGQHLNAVAPCYNPAHHHARPEASVEGLAGFWAAIYKAAHDANPDAVVELCPCGTAFAFHNLPATDQYPSADPLSSWQVRSKGKAIKALMGDRSSYAGDHVELSDGHDDFASSVGIGAVISSKFTWPRDTEHPSMPMPPGGYVLTAEREALWRRWVGLYKTHMLPKGEYLGTLYDIGFDTPETHVIAKDKALYYTFYAQRWDGTLELRGLPPGRWQLHDLFNDRPLGSVEGGAVARLPARFSRFLFVQASPAGTAA